MTTTTHDIPVSLALLWQRWQEIEELPEHDKKVLAELGVIEARIIDQPATNARDVVAKLKFLAHIARDHNWNDSLERLYASILSAQEKFLDLNEPIDQLSLAIHHFEGIGECLESVGPDAPDPVSVCEYLGRHLRHHAIIANAAVGAVSTEHFTKVFLKEAVALFGASEAVAAGETSSTTSPAEAVLEPLPESLAAAEKEIAELETRSDQLSAAGDQGDHPEIWNRVFALGKWIAVTPPSTLAEVAVKLRRLADPHSGMEAGDCEEDVISVRQALAIVEAELAKGVKRHAIGTPDRHPIRTPLGAGFRVVPVANRRDPRGAE